MVERLAWFLRFHEKYIERLKYNQINYLIKIGENKEVKQNIQFHLV